MKCKDCVMLDCLPVFFNGNIKHDVVGMCVNKDSLFHGRLMMIDGSECYWIEEKDEQV